MILEIFDIPDLVLSASITQKKDNILKSTVCQRRGILDSQLQLGHINSLLPFNIGLGDVAADLAGLFVPAAHGREYVLTVRGGKRLRNT